MDSLATTLCLHVRTDQPLGRFFVRPQGDAGNLLVRVPGRVESRDMAINSGGVVRLTARTEDGDAVIWVDRTVPGGYRYSTRGDRELVVEIDKPLATRERPSAASAIAPTIRVAGLRQAAAALPGPWRVIGADVGGPMGGKLVTLDFVHADIQDVLKALAIQSQCNILVAPKAEAKDITVSLANVTPDKAMDYVVRLAGLAYGYEDNTRTYIVCARDQIDQIFPEGGTGKVIFPPPVGKTGPAAEVKHSVEKTQNIPAAEAARLLLKLCPGLTEAKEVDTNILSLAGPADQYDAATTTLKSLDTIWTPTKAPAPPATTFRVVKTNKIPADAAVPLVQKLVPGIAEVKVMDKNILVMTATKEQLDAAEAAVKTLDDAYPAPAAVPAPGAAQADMEVQPYNLKYVSASDAGNLIRGLMETNVLPKVVIVAAPAPVFPTAAGSTGGSSGQTLTGGTPDSTSALIALMAARNATPGSPTAPPTVAPVPGGPAGPPGTVAIPANTATNTLLLIGAHDDIAKVSDYLAKVDIAPKQVMIDVKVTDVTLSAAQRLGITWNWSSFTGQEVTPTSGSNGGSSSGGSSTSSTLTNNLQLGRFGHVPVSFQATLEAMVNTDKARLLANPRVAVLDNRTAVIHVGDTVRYLASRTVTQTGISVQTGAEEVGVVVQVSPRIGENVITLDVRPKVKVITGFTATGDGGQLPNTSERSVETVVRLKDGETLAIGGLIRDEDVDSMQRVPGLSNLPLIGELFKFRSKTRTNSEVLIFITPTLVPEA